MAELGSRRNSFRDPIGGTGVQHQPTSATCRLQCARFRRVGRPTVGSEGEVLTPALCEHVSYVCEQTRPSVGPLIGPTNKDKLLSCGKPVPSPCMRLTTASQQAGLIGPLIGPSNYASPGQLEYFDPTKISFCPAKARSFGLTAA